MPARADTGDDLRVLQAREQSQRAALAALGAQQKVAQATLGTLRSDLDAKQADLGVVRRQVDRLSDQIAGIQTTEEHLATEHDKRIRYFSLEVRSQYKNGPLGPFLFLFAAADFSQFLDRFAAMTRIAQINFDEAQFLRGEELQLQADQARTQALRAGLGPLLAELTQKETEARTAFNAQAAAESGLEAAQRQALAGLLSTQRREKDLEAALAAADAAAAAAARKGAGLSYGPTCPAAPAGQVSFCGHGWGHGVGLGQYGALGMAQAGMGWQQIVTSFYSGAGLTTVPEPQTVRIHLTGAGPSITPQAAASIQDSGGAVKGSVAAGQAVAFSRQPDGTVAASWPGGTATGNPLRLVPAAGSTFQVSGTGRHYRGEAWVSGGSGLAIVNHVDLEDYLRGLAEVPSSWPVGAIAAQIVAARSYALYHLGGGTYDGDDTTAFQVYQGSDREAASQNQAVQATLAQVLSYNGGIVDAVFSSSDGGHTECASAIWGQGDTPCTPAYLRGVIDNYDVSPLHTWYTPPHTVAEIQSYLGATYNAASCGTLTGFNLGQRDASDRLKAVGLVGTTGTCTVSPSTFIAAINRGSPANFVVYGSMFGVTPGNHGWPYW